LIDEFDISNLAFDIDGVVADTMSVFVRLACERYGLAHLSKEQMTSYDLYQCLGLDREVIDDLICLTLSDEYTLQIPPMPGAPEVLTLISEQIPLRFITARLWPESIIQWLEQILPEVPSGRIHVIATGAPEAKATVLEEMGIRVFVEDRLETCVQLAQAGIQPIVFDQPWNRVSCEPPLPRVTTWSQLKQWFLPPIVR
jgi:uncharacterized HAD superfamily protein